VVGEEYKGVGVDKVAGLQGIAEVVDEAPREEGVLAGNKKSVELVVKVVGGAAEEEVE
jgi:hypothetical protein